MEDWLNERLAALAQKGKERKEKAAAPQGSNMRKRKAPLAAAAALDTEGAPYVLNGLMYSSSAEMHRDFTLILMGLKSPAHRIPVRRFSPFTLHDDVQVPMRVLQVGRSAGKFDTLFISAPLLPFSDSELCGLAAVATLYSDEWRRKQADGLWLSSRMPVPKFIEESNGRVPKCEGKSAAQIAACIFAIADQITILPTLQQKKRPQKKVKVATAAVAEQMTRHSRQQRPRRVASVRQHGSVSRGIARLAVARAREAIGLEGVAGGRDQPSRGR